MSDQKPPRLPACARGTDHRIDCGDHYWVRLVTRKAMKAEGECMQNCLRGGSYHDHAGPDDLTDSALWSLRRAEDAVSIALAMVDESGHLTQFKGPYNNQASGTAYRQLQYLGEYLRAGGSEIKFRSEEVIVGEDRATYRADKAPKELRDAIEAKRAAERAEWESRRAERQAEDARHLQEMRAAMTEMVEGGTRQTLTWARPPRVGHTESMFDAPLGIEAIRRSMRRLESFGRSRVDTDEPVIEATRERDGEGFWSLILRTPGSNEIQGLQRVLMSDEPEVFDYTGASDRTTFVRRFRNADGTWRLAIDSRVSVSGIVPRCIFPEEGETAPAPAPVDQAPRSELQALEQSVNAGVIPRGAIPEPTPRYVFVPTQLPEPTFRRLTVQDQVRSLSTDIRGSFMGLYDRIAAATGLQNAQIEDCWQRALNHAARDFAPASRPTPAPDLTTPRGRTEAAMQRRQAQLADRRWVQENLREQRRARR